MKTVLALDISTSCTGVSIFQEGRLIKACSIETSSKKFDSVFDKMTHLLNEITLFCKGFDVNYIAAEAAFKKFAMGKSNASVLALLIGFNFCLVYNLTKIFSAKEIFIDVKNARKSVGLKMLKGADAKMIVYEYVSKKYPDLNWTHKKTGKPKDWTIDMADSIVIGEAVFLNKLIEKTDELQS
jgi:hypothetical protein